MATESEASLLVLLGLRLAAFGPADRVASLTGVDVVEVAAHLEDLAAQGWAVRREGRTAGWSLTPRGRAEGERRLAAELDRAGVRPVVTAAYRSFLAHNRDVLAVCTAWQVRADNSVNLHDDPAYDAEVIERLGVLHASAGPILTQLGDALARFGGYRGRLDAAFGRVRAGEGEWLAGALVPSYHAVWFELHENLLATLGIDRSREAPI